MEVARYVRTGAATTPARSAAASAPSTTPSASTRLRLSRTNPPAAASLRLSPRSSRELLSARPADSTAASASGAPPPCPEARTRSAFARGTESRALPPPDASTTRRSSSSGRNTTREAPCSGNSAKSPEATPGAGLGQAATRRRTVMPASSFSPKSDAAAISSCPPIPTSSPSPGTKPRRRRPLPMRAVPGSMTSSSP